jgi:GNAT superfamily N-acetyltransferase
MGIEGRLRIVPASRATWDDLACVLEGVKLHGSPCYCQRYKVATRDWQATDPDERALRFREQTDCGHPDSDATSGLVAYLDDEPVGWCAVEPRVAYPELRSRRVPWAGRREDKDDPGVWSVTCLITRVGHRRQGVTYPLVAAAVEHARQHGARAIEGYPMITTPGEEITWGELSVGPRGAFAAAGFREVTHPSARRVVMRIDLR